jgi:prepilin-type N-terminal cleavage/methylation domain-containing protein
LDACARLSYSLSVLVRLRGARGFTLVELMVVVSIVAVLAAIAIASLRRYIFSSKVVEANGMIQSIRVAQESWKGTHGSYLDVSGPNLTSYFPDNAPGMNRRSFYTGSGDLNTRWRLLNPTIPGPVLFSYSVVAGLPGSAMVNPNLADSAGLPSAAPDHWYVIEAIGDPEADGLKTTCASTSISDDVVCQGD